MPQHPHKGNSHTSHHNRLGSPPGRYTYYTAEEARRVADRLGVDGVHSHMIDVAGQQERIFMPGRSHAELNDALRAQGMQPAPMPGNGMGGGMGDPVGMGMSDRQAEMEIRELMGRREEQDEDEDRPGGVLGFGLF